MFEDILPYAKFSAVVVIVYIVAGLDKAEADNWVTIVFNWVIEVAFEGEMIYTQLLVDVEWE